MVKDIKWNINIQKPELVKLFVSHKDLMKNGGGSCENLLSKIKVSHSIRVLGKDENYKFVITKEDVDEAFLLLKKYDGVKVKKQNFDYYT